MPEECGTSYFASDVVASPSIGCTHVLFADVDGDGVVDRVIHDGGLQVQYLLADGTVRASSERYEDPAATVMNAAMADVDGDGKSEIVAGSETALWVMRAGGDGALQTLASFTLDARVFGPRAVAGYFRGKSQMDVLVETAPGTFTLHGFESGAFVRGPALSGVGDMGSETSGVQAGSRVVAVDVDGDGLDEVLYPTATGIGISHLGSASAWQQVQDIAYAGGYRRLATGDFDGNGRLDIAALPLQSLNSFQPPLRTWLQSPSATFSAIADVTFSASSIGLLAADLDGDKLPELVLDRTVGHFAHGTWQLSGIPLGIESTNMLMDVDGDGLLDAVGRDRQAFQCSAMRGGRADIGVVGVDSPVTVRASDQLSLSFDVTNHGPSAVTDVALSTTPKAVLTVPGCTMDDCKLSLGVGQTVRVSASVTYAPDEPFEFRASACSALIDPIPSNDTGSVSVNVTPTAALGVLGSFNGDHGRFTSAFIGINGGPSIAKNVRMVIELPPATSGYVWQAGPGACSAQGTTVTCTRAELGLDDPWNIPIEGAFDYHGQAFGFLVTISNDVEDPNLKDNTFGLSLGEQPLFGGAGSSSTGSSDSGGCACRVGRPAPPAASASLAALALAYLIGRRRRKR